MPHFFSPGSDEYLLKKLHLGLASKRYSSKVILVANSKTPLIVSLNS